MQKFCHWSFIWMITWMEDNCHLPVMQCSQTTSNDPGRRLFEIDAVLYMWTVLIALYYLKRSSMFPVPLLQKGSYDRILSTDSKVRMIHTVPLKGKLTVTCVSILETRFSRVDYRFSKLLRMESRVSVIKDQVSMFVSGNIMTFSWERTC